MFPSFESKAYTTLYEEEVLFSTIFPKVYGSLDETVVIEQNYEKQIATGITYTPDNYYLVYCRQFVKEKIDFLYENSDKDYFNYKLYLKYGGQKYYFNSEYCSFVVPGSNSGVFTLGVDATIELSPYWANDGYIYQNTCQAELYSFHHTYDTGSSMLRIRCLESSEVAEAKQFSEMINLLTSIDISNTSILNKLNKILSQTTQLEDSVSALYDLIVEVYGQDDADKILMDSFQDKSSSQGSQLGQLTQDSQVNKIDINSASSTIDSNIDMDNVGEYGVLLSTFTNNSRILSLILISLSVALVAYVFFGKR